MCKPSLTSRGDKIDSPESHLVPNNMFYKKEEKIKKKLKGMYCQLSLTPSVQNVTPSVQNVFLSCDILACPGPYRAVVLN